MERSKPAENPPMLPVVGAIFLGLVLMDLFKLWFPANVSSALGAFIGTLSMGFAKTLRFSWRRLMLGALGIAVAAFAVSVLRDVIVNWLQK